MAKFQLYRLTDLEIGIQRILDNDEDIDHVEWERRLAVTNVDWEDKAIAIGKHYMSTQAEIKMLDDEIDRLKRKAIVLSNKNKKSLDYLEYNMRETKREFVDATIFKIRFRKLPASVEITDTERIPDEFMRVIPESKEPDKRTILASLKEGVAVEGCRIVTNKTKLEIV